jgi:signal transduction histidine kinase
MPTSSAVTRSAPVLAWSLAGIAVCVSVAAVILGEAGSGASWKTVLAPWFFAFPGAMVAAARPGNPLGWLMLAVATCFAGTALTSDWVDRGDGGAWAVWFTDRASAVLVPTMLGILLLLPDGHLPSPRWRSPAGLVLSAQLLLVVVWCLVEGPAAAPDTSLSSAGEVRNPVGVLPSSWGSIVADLEWLLQLPLLLGIVAVAVRLRRPPDDERRRLVDVLAAAAAFTILVVVGRALWPTAADVLDVAASALLATALTSAILRRRLPGVDVVVHHAFVYAALTALIALGYVGVVAVGGRLGQDLPAYGVGVVTGALALSLLPLRGLLQRLLERAMYGEAREPGAAVRRLAETVGDATSLDGVVSGLARATFASLRAAHVEVEVEGVRAIHGRAGSGEEVRLPLVSGDRRLGTMTVGLPRGRRFRQRDRDALAELADHGGRAVHAVQLADALLTNRQLLITAREAERSRLRRELHDELGPTLAGLAMQLGGLQEILRTDPAVASERLARLEAAARHALDDVRSVSRRLRPPALDELGLVGAVVRAAEEAGLALDPQVDALPDLPAAVEVAAYRIAVEAALNVVRHTGLRTAELSVFADNGTLHLRMRDDGPGIGEAPAGVGILAMRERAEELGGTLVVRGERGTLVEARLPLAAAGSRPMVPGPEAERAR